VEQEIKMDPVTGSLIVGGAGALLGLAGTSETNSANKEIAKMNIDMQRETNAKNEALMRESWMRDDSAVQRRALDLAKAGMSPLLAAGSAAGSSPVISYKAPESHQVVQQSGLAGAISGLYQGVMAQQSMMDMLARQQQVLIAQGSLSVAELQNRLNREEQYNRNAATASNLRTQELEQRLQTIGLKWEDQKQVLNILKQMQEYDTGEHNYLLSRQIGLRTGDSPGTIGKVIMALNNAAMGYPESPMNKAKNEILGESDAERAKRYFQKMAFDPNKKGGN